jgi:hypothetical protein
MMVRKAVVWSGLVSAVMVGSFLAAVPAQAAPGGLPGPPAWSHEGGRPGCGTAQVAVPQQSAAYYAANPDAFVTDPGMPSGMRDELAQIAKREPTIVTAISCTPGLTHKPVDPVSATSTTSQYWSGYVAPLQSTALYSSISWTEPTMSSAPAGTSTQMASWTGLGSGSSASNELVQAGTEQDQTPTAQTPYFFYELYPYEAEIKVSGIYVAPGDSLTVLVYFTTITHVATFDFYNNTRNQYVSVSQSLPAFHAYIGAQAEWIVERPEVGGAPSALGQFTQISVSNARFQTDASGTVLNAASVNTNKWTLTNAAGTPLATPGAIGAGTFSVTFLRSS